jgi:S1-C subfamily serine protease
MNGAVVRAVKPGSPADTAGLHAGDIIVGVGNQKVTSPADANRAISAALSEKNHAVALRVLRDGEVAFVGVSVDQNAG